jgi:hypothetical protein
MNKAAIIAAAAGLALASAAVADSEWAADVSGSWAVASNWSPIDIPDSAGELATIGAGPDIYFVDIDALSPAVTTIGGLVLSHADATLDIFGGKTLSIAGTTFLNNGIVLIDSNTSVADGVLVFETSTTITGTGSVRLNRNIDARLETGVGAVITNTATIDGGGRVNAALVNTGLVEAGPAGTLELITNDKSNSGTMRAGPAGILSIDDITITQTGAGLIEAVDGTVNFPVGIHRVDGGRFDTSGAGTIELVSGSNLTVDTITNDGILNIQGGGDLLVEGGITNNGTIFVDSNSSVADGRLFFNETGTISGTGVVRLNRNIDAVMDADVGVVVTVGANQTIEGNGFIHANLINNGTIDAESAAGTIDFRTNDKTNNSLMVARLGGTLNIATITTTQSASAILRADGGTLLVAAGTTGVDGGTIEVINGGVFQAVSGANLALVDVDLVGPFDMQGGSTVTVTTNLTNDGTITIDSNNSTADGLLTTAGDATIDGTGTIRLNRNFDAVLDSAAASTLTIGAGQLVEGPGKLRANLVNNGIIDCETASGVMLFAGNNKVNNNLMRARNGGTLNITTVITTQAPGAQMLADGGTIHIASGAGTRIENGSLDTLNGGLVQIVSGGTLALNDVDFTGDMDVHGNGTLVVDATIANDGTINLDSNGSTADGILTTVADATITGTGTIKLNRNNDARITTPDGFTLTLSAGQTVIGNGDIEAAIINNGIIDADVINGVIAMQVNAKTNNNMMKATAGILDLSGVTIDQTGGGSMLATDGGLVRVTAAGGPARLEGGTLTTANGSIVSVPSSASLTMQNVAFAGQMDIAGNGTVIAEGTLTNNGLIIVNNNSSSADAFLTIEDTGSLVGTGEVRLSRAGPDSRLSTPGSATLGAGQTITGSGRIEGVWAFAGSIAPGLSIGTINTVGTLNMGSTASLDVELATTSSFDKVNGTGVINLDGTLNIAFDGYVPVKNDVFRIIEGSSITSQFATVNGPTLPDGLVYGIFYDPTFVELRITCGPDLNLDGLLDFFDVQFFLSAFAAGEPAGDFNEDGLFDFFDVLAFLDAFSTGCP